MPAPANPRRKLRFLSFLTIAVIALGAAYYFSFYTQKREYVIDRNFRRLSVISEQIESRMDGLYRILINTAENTEYDPQRNDSLDKLVDTALDKVEDFRSERNPRQQLPLPVEKYIVDSVLVESVKSIEAGRSNKKRARIDAQQRKTTEELSKQVLELEQTTIDNPDVPVQERTNNELDEVQGALSKAVAAIDYLNFKERIAGAIGIVPFATLEYADTVASTRQTDTTQHNIGATQSTSRIEKVELERNILYLTCRNVPALGPDLIIRVSVDINEMISQQIKDIVFDNVYLAEAGGAVIYQFAKQRGNVRAFNKVRSLADTETELEFNTLGQSGGLFTADLAGETQILFARPLALQLNIRDSLGFSWVLVATVPSTKLLSESLALPTNSILIFSLLGALFVLAWPLLNIVFAGTFSRLRKIDIAFLGLSAFVASALIALGLVDLYQMTNMRRVYDEQLEHTARIAHKNVRQELRQAHNQLRFLADSLKPRLKDLSGAWTYTPLIIETQRPLDSVRSEKLFLERLLPRASNLLNFRRGDTVPSGKNIGWHYLNFDRVFFADESGDIRAKLAVGSAATPFLNIGRRDYYRQVERRDLLTLHYPSEANPAKDSGRSADDGDVIAMALSQHHSWASGAYETTMAIPIDSDPASTGGWMAGMDISTFASFRDPLLPPTFNLVLVDEDGNVLYHTRPERSGFENFLVECDNNPRLASTLAGRRSDWMSSTYWGEDRRIYTLPLHETPWTIICYYNEEALVDGSNVGLLISTISFYGVNLLLLMALILMGLSSSKVQLDWLWPSFIDYQTYRKLSYIYLGFLVFYIVALSQELRFDHVLIAALLLPVFFVFVTYFSLKRQQELNIRIILILIPFVGFYPVFAALQLFGHMHEFAIGLRFAASFFLLFGLPASIVGIRHWYKRKRAPRRDWRYELFVSATIYHLLVFSIQTASFAWGGRVTEALYHLVLIALTAFALHQFQSKRNYMTRDQYLNELYRHRSGRVAGAPSARVFRRTYRVFLIILMLLTGILPMIAYFTLANQAVFNLLLKHSQKEMAEHIIQRESEIGESIAGLTTTESEFLRKRLQHDPRGMYHSSFFNTEISHFVEHESLDSSVQLHEHGVNPFGVILPRLLNKLQFAPERGLPTRQVIGTQAQDSVWHTGEIDSSDRAVLLHRRLNGGPSIMVASDASTPGMAVAATRPKQLAIFLTLLMASLVCTAILYWATYKFGEQVLLTRFANPRSNMDEDITIPLNAPLFVVCRPLTTPDAILRRLQLPAAQQCDDIEFDHEQNDFPESDFNDDWRQDAIHICVNSTDDLNDVPAASTGKTPVFLIEAFNLDPEYSAANIKFLIQVNKLRASSNGIVVVMGSIDPAVAFTDHSFSSLADGAQAAPIQEGEGVRRNSAEAATIDNIVAARAFANWETVFYTEMHDSQLFRAELEVMADEAGVSGPEVQACINILAYECYMTDWLRHKGKRIFEQFCREHEGFDEAALRRQILLSAEPLYQAIWHTCSRGEKVLLANLSREGILNGKNTLGVRSLLNKQLMMLVPDPRVINDSFREYIRRDDIQAEANALAEGTARSAWENLRLPLIVLLVAGGAFLMVTQHEIVDMTTAIISAVTVLLPGILKALDFFRQGRSAAGG